MYAQNGVLESGYAPCLDSYLANCISHTALNKRIDISDIGAVVQYLKRAYTTFSYRVVRVIKHKMAYRKATAMRV